jgi:monoamine oxidase
LREKALITLTHNYQKNSQKTSIKPQAMELLALSQERIKLPNFWQWLIKKMSIASEEYQEIEAARLGLTQCSCQQRSELERLFEKEI